MKYVIKSISLFAIIILLQRPSRSDTAEESFAKRQIKLAGQILTVEIADTGPKQMRGLMERRRLSPNEGMLFDFDPPRELGFWMKNTRIPLSIAFFDAKRRYINTHEMQVEKKETAEANYKIYRSSKLAKYALELPAGWFKKHRLSPGESVFSFVDEAN